MKKLVSFVKEAVVRFSIFVKGFGPCGIFKSVYSRLAIVFLAN